MPVYVDNEKYPVRRMLMCHMLADSLSELHEMADKIGVSRKWFQNKKNGTPHYDICQSKRKLALKFGAIEADRKKTVDIIRLWRRKNEEQKNMKTTTETTTQQKADAWNLKYKIGETVMLKSVTQRKMVPVELRSTAFIDKASGRVAVFVSKYDKAVSLDQLGPVATSFSLAEQIREVKREIGKRKTFYPRWINAGKLSQEQADKHLALMEAVLVTLEGIQEKPTMQTSLFGEAIK